MKTKPFDLQKALSGHQVVSKGGAKVIQIAYFPTAELLGFRLQVLLEGQRYPLSYSEEGKCYGYDDRSPYDLFMEVKTEKRWARIVRRYDCGTFEITGGFQSKSYAEFSTVGEEYEVLPAYEYEVEV
jgi:hypothetical protein